MDIVIYWNKINDLWHVSDLNFCQNIYIFNIEGCDGSHSDRAEIFIPVE